MYKKLIFYDKVLKRFNVDEGKFPPWWLRTFRFVMFPIESTKLVVKRNFEFRDVESQCYLIHGMKFSHTFFATLIQNTKEGRWFKFTRREDGFMDIETRRDNEPGIYDFMKMDEQRLDEFRKSWAEPGRVIQTHLHEPEKILVIAGTHNEFMFWLEKHPYLKGVAIYANSENTIKGYRLKYVILTGQYWKNPLSRSGEYKRYCDKEYVENEQ